jgi:hypothetical protein
MHGAHKSRNVANGAKSGKYKNGYYTKEAKEKSRKSLVKLRYLEDLGQQGGFMKGARTRGRKPAGYIKLDLSKAENLVIAIETINKE